MKPIGPCSGGWVPDVDTDPGAVGSAAHDGLGALVPVCRARPLQGALSAHVPQEFLFPFLMFLLVSERQGEGKR